MTTLHRIPFGLLAGLGLATVAGCEREVPPTLEEVAADKCPKVHLDRLSGDWIVSSGDVRNRMRIMPKGDGYEVWYVGGMLWKSKLDGVKRDRDLQLTEVPLTDQRRDVVAQGLGSKVRMYIEPVYRNCSLKVYSGTVELDGTEQVDPRTKEFLEFPEQEIQFAWQPATEVLFLGEAAKRKSVADQQLAEGGPRPDTPGSNAVPVGMWSKAAEDGPESCSYDMDLYFDDQLVEERRRVPAGDVRNGFRHWYVDWDANWSFNHTFEIHRFRSCGGTRELIAVAGIEAVLT